MTYEEAHAAAVTLYDAIRDESRSVAEMTLTVAIVETFLRGFSDATVVCAREAEHAAAERRAVEQCATLTLTATKH